MKAHLFTILGALLCALCGSGARRRRFTVAAAFGALALGAAAAHELQIDEGYIMPQDLHTPTQVTLQLVDGGGTYQEKVAFFFFYCTKKWFFIFL